jgi:hypothetical protein
MGGGSFGFYLADNQLNWFLSSIYLLFVELTDFEFTVCFLDWLTTVKDTMIAATTTSMITLFFISIFFSFL